jgi:hypothetical protein
MWEWSDKLKLGRSSAFVKRARQGNRLASFVQAIEMLVTFGGCPHGRARQRKYGVPPSEPVPPQDGPSSLLAVEGKGKVEAGLNIDE